MEDAEASEPSKKRERDTPENNDVKSNNKNQDEDKDKDDSSSWKRTKLETSSGGGGDDDGSKDNNDKNGQDGVRIEPQQEQTSTSALQHSPPPGDEKMPTTKGGDPASSIHPPVAAALSPVLTRSRASEKARNNGTASNNDDDASQGDQNMPESNKRWRVHQMAEDYMELAGNMMYPATQLRPYGHDPDRREYPLEGMSLLGYLKSPIRRPSIIERWSPHEIALFEAGLFHHGKEFNLVSKIVQTKSTKDIIDFYYIWKKTSHYTKWKSQFIPSSDLIDMESPVKGAKL